MKRKLQENPVIGLHRLTPNLMDIVIRNPAPEKTLRRNATKVRGDQQLRKRDVTIPRNVNRTAARSQ